MKFRKWAYLFLAVSVGLIGQRADAALVPQHNLTESFTCPPQCEALGVAVQAPATDLIIEEIYPLGYAEDGDCLDMVICVSPETYNRIFCIVKSPLGLELKGHGQWEVESGESLTKIWKYLTGRLPSPSGKDHGYAFSYEEFEKRVQANMNLSDINQIQLGQMIDFRKPAIVVVVDEDRGLLPITVVDIPGLVAPGTKPLGFWQKSWAGVAGDAHGEIFVGRHGSAGVLFNLRDPRISHSFSMQGWKFGGGGGGGAGAVLVFITNVRPDKIRGFKHKGGGADWDVSLGGQLGNAAKSVKGLGPLLKILKEKKNLKRAKDAAENVLKNLGAINDEQRVIILSTPVGGGMEIWGGYKATVLEVQ